jgi:hypothetical protein
MRAAFGYVHRRDFVNVRSWGARPLARRNQAYQPKMCATSLGDDFSSRAARLPAKSGYGNHAGLEP